MLLFGAVSSSRTHVKKKDMGACLNERILAPVTWIIDSFFHHHFHNQRRDVSLACVVLLRAELWEAAEQKPLSAKCELQRYKPIEEARNRLRTFSTSLVLDNWIQKLIYMYVNLNNL